MQDQQASEGFKVRGHVKIFLDGVLVDEGHNLIVDQGMGYLLNNWANVSATNPAYIITTDSTGAVAAGETAVPATVLGYKAVSKTVDAAFADVTFSCTFATSESNGTVGSVAIASGTGGTGEFCRYVLASAVTKTSSNTLTVEYAHEFTW